VVSDVPVDDEAPQVTSGISRSVVVGPSEVLIGVGFTYVYSYIRVSVRACCERLRCEHIKKLSARYDIMQSKSRTIIGQNHKTLVGDFL
jgi:hypothetical protein